MVAIHACSSANSFTDSGEDCFTSFNEEASESDEEESESPLRAWRSAAAQGGWPKDFGFLLSISTQCGQSRSRSHSPSKAVVGKDSMQGSTDSFEEAKPQLSTGYMGAQGIEACRMVIDSNCTVPAAATPPQASMKRPYPCSADELSPAKMTKITSDLEAVCELKI